MKKVICGLLLLVGAVASAKDVYVNSYYRKDGTYVQGYHRTSPDNDVYNNYSTKGNVNPYTGKEGTVDPDPYETQSGNTSDGYGD